MIIVIWKTMNENISQFLPMMTCVLHCPPWVLCFCLLSVVRPWIPFSSVTSQLQDSCLPALLLWAIGYTLGWGLWEPTGAWVSHVCPSLSLREVGSPFLPTPIISSTGAHSSASEQSTCSVSELITLAVLLFCSLILPIYYLQHFQRCLPAVSLLIQLQQYDTQGETQL